MTVLRHTRPTDIPPASQVDPTFVECPCGAVYTYLRRPLPAVYRAWYVAHREHVQEDAA